MFTRAELIRNYLRHHSTDILWECKTDKMHDITCYLLDSGKRIIVESYNGQILQIFKQPGKISKYAIPAWIEGSNQLTLNFN